MKQDSIALCMHLKKEIANLLAGVVNHVLKRRGGHNCLTSITRSFKSLKYSQIYDVVCQLALRIVGVALNFAVYDSPV